MDTQKKETYNGWTNYETWNIALWIDNDQGSQDTWRDEAESAYAKADADKIFTKKENAVNALRETLKEWFEAQAEERLEFADVSSSWVADLLHASLSEVNWQEIAEHLVNDLEA